MSASSGRPRTFAFDGRPSRAEYIDAIRAALEDEGLALSLGSWGRITTTIVDGQLVVSVPQSSIRSTTA